MKGTSDHRELAASGRAKDKPSFFSLLIPAVSLALLMIVTIVAGRVMREKTVETTRDTLLSVAEEQRVTFDTALRGQFSTLNAMSLAISEYDAFNVGHILPAIQKLAESEAFSDVGYALSDGFCRVSDGMAVDISNYAYFQQAMAGERSFQRLDNALTGESAFLLAVPITIGGRTIGVVQGSYTEEAFRRQLLPNTVVNSAIVYRESGKPLAGTGDGGLYTPGQDVLALLEASAPSAPRIREDLEAGLSDAFPCAYNGSRYYVAYLPLTLKTAAGEELAMLCTIPAEPADASGRRNSLIGALLMGLAVLAAGLTFFYFYCHERKNVRLILNEREQLRQKAEQLRASEEQNRFAISVTGMNVSRYDLKTGAYYNNSELLYRQGFGNTIENVPQAFIDAGLVAPECVDDFRAFYDNLRKGKNSVLFASLKLPDGSFRWFRKDATFVLDADGQPYQAIVAYRDVTEQREQEAVFVKWQQSIEERPLESYTLFRCNLTKGASFDKREGTLLGICFDPDLNTFNQRTREYAGRFVHLDDFDAYVSLLNSEALLAGYYRGVTRASLDYRERVTEGEYRWLRVTVEMAQYPDASDIEVFLMYESITDAKLAELAVSTRIDTDPLTGVLNRPGFIDRLNHLLAVDGPEEKHALLLLDIDNFHALNDAFGHAAGDEALIDVAASLRSALAVGDLLGRLGGDEFLICFKNAPNQTVTEKKVMRIQALMRKAYSLDIRLSASLGIATYPDDGKDFNALYHCVDMALHAAKENGKDSFAFYNGDAHSDIRPDAAPAAEERKNQRNKRRVVIVDDDPETVALVNAQLGTEFIVETCVDEAAAMGRLRRYGFSLSVILLSLDIPGLDAFSILDKARSSEALKSVPVIVVSRTEERELSLKALRHGARDFILKPIDGEALRLRIASAVSKTENERLRAQNMLLQIKNTDGDAYRTVFKNTGTVVVEYDWQKGVFSYDPAITELLYGRYDGRSLWQIWLSDMVADAMDVHAVQMLLHDLANDRQRVTATMDIMLKTSSKAKHWFTINAFKRLNELNLTSKIILTIVDVNDTILASKKLRFQAEHDDLTELYNRACFLRLVEETVREKPAGSYVLLCCDINDFRFINERFGREEGDKLLKFAAEKLLVYSKLMNGFTGRLSNDIYAMLLPNAPGILTKAVGVIKEFFKDYPLKARITCRAGAYVITDPDMTADSMLDLASTASDTIKGKFEAWLAVYESGMSVQRQREKEIADHMETALAEGQFDVYIQPQFNHANGQFLGAEALVRWIDPQKGVISPGDFIPVFEKNGFITKLDEYVWERTARYLSEWIQKGNEPFPISVNVSREDLNDPKLCEKLLGIVEKYGIPIRYFRLEITESLFAKDIKRLTAVVEQLHEKGFLIEMDDFGSGYSSLNILKDVPVDILKLDMRFFSGDDALGRGGMIVNAVLRMARWLSIPVIAEGVEQKEQADFLLSIGCPTIQGYLYEKPMPARDFEKKHLEGRSAREAAGETADVETELKPSSFWNPLSADSQIFNNYIGPAAVFEYHDGGYELVRMNRRFIDALHISEETMLPACGFLLVSEADADVFKNAVCRVSDTGREEKTDVHLALADSGFAPFCATLRRIARSDGRALLFIALDA